MNVDQRKAERQLAVRRGKRYRSNDYIRLRYRCDGATTWSLTQGRRRDHPGPYAGGSGQQEDDPMITTILKALGLLKLLYELLDKLIPGLAALRRWLRRRRARQQSVQSVNPVTSRRGRPWIDRRIDRPWIDRRTTHSPVASAADDVLLRPAPEPLASYMTRPVLAKDLTRR
jgi:hypothetical protein